MLRPDEADVARHSGIQLVSRLASQLAGLLAFILSDRAAHEALLNQLSCVGQLHMRAYKPARLICCGAVRLVPYLQLLVVPLLGRMSDPLPAVRRLAAPAFASIVALVPLAQVSMLQLLQMACSRLVQRRSPIWMLCSHFGVDERQCSRSICAWLQGSLRQKAKPLQRQPLCCRVWRCRAGWTRRSRPPGPATPRSWRTCRTHPQR